MAKEANYILKMTLTETATVQLALNAYKLSLEQTAQRLIARRDPVGHELTEQIDAAARLLARI